MQTEEKTRQEGGKRQRVQANMLTVYINGKRHVVPEHATIMRAIEYAGHQIIRGAGCRSHVRLHLRSPHVRVLKRI